MNTLPKIPTALGVRWNQLRRGLMPYLVFATMVAITVGLWSRVNQARMTVGVAEGVRSVVTSPWPGQLRLLTVRPYQLVQAGEVIAVVVPADDPRASLDRWRGEVDLERLRLQPSLAEQNAMSFERLRLELAGTKAELAIAKVNLQRAENEVARNTPLYREQLVSEDLYDLSLQTRNALQAEVEEKSRAVAFSEERMHKLQALADPEMDGGGRRQHARLERLEAARTSLATNWGPILLRAPITGMIGGVLRQQGEHVADGEPLVTINSLWAEHLVAYLRQPYVIEPQVGLKAKLTSRNYDRATYDSQVVQVGAQVEVITNVLAYIKPGALVDVGLPVVMELPPHAKVRPGELLDVVIENPHARPFNLWEKLFSHGAAPQ